MNRRELLAAAVAVPVLGVKPEPTADDWPGSAYQLRKYRTRARLTISEAATMAEIPVAKWRDWENGASVPLAPDLAAFCRVLDVSPVAFLGLA